MDKNFKEQLHEWDITHKKNLRGYNVSEQVKNITISGIFPFIEYTDIGPLNAVIVITRLIINIGMYFGLFSTLCPLVEDYGQSALWALLYTLILYVIFFLTIYIVARRITDKYWDKLLKLENMFHETMNRSALSLIVERNIIGNIDTENCAIQLENGMYYSTNGLIRKKISVTSTAPYEIYRITNTEDSSKYSSRKYSSSENPPLTTMEKNIASVDFNRKFGIVCRDADKVAVMKHFTSIFQLQLINSVTLGKCFNITIEDGVFNSSSEYIVKRYEGRTAIFINKPISKYFEDIEKYYDTVCSNANAINKDLEKIEF